VTAKLCHCRYHNTRRATRALLRMADRVRKLVTA
jgi:uncharacterized protein YjiS (DUF1127 family)